jgi:peptidoglycan/LPS O-acetylase OafA/YrhL
MSSLATEFQPQTRLTSIDALRGIAALGVVLYHAISQTANSIPANLFYWPVKLLDFLSSFGYIGVFLFFVISGFCIHLQWTRSQLSGGTQRIAFGPFWKRRVRRLYPPYLIAFALFLLMAAATTGIDVTHFFLYDVVMHLLMLHNLDPHTCYSINGVFWTLAVEEQLYLGYFLLLFLRKRFGWAPTLMICAVARVGWFYFGHVVWLVTGYGLPVPEAALSHWFTWALGALAVEAAFGLITLPKWCRSILIGTSAVVAASAISYYLPYMGKDNPSHNAAWLLMHPLWGFGFFVLVNRFVSWEQGRIRAAEREMTASRMPHLVTAAATVGVFSYSLYLTHELVIMQAWRFSSSLPAILNTLFVITPATLLFAYVFFAWFELPFLKKASQAKRVKQPELEQQSAKSEVLAEA